MKQAIGPRARPTLAGAAVARRPSANSRAKES